MTIGHGGILSLASTSMIADLIFICFNTSAEKNGSGDGVARHKDCRKRGSEIAEAESVNIIVKKRRFAIGTAHLPRELLEGHSSPLLKFEVVSNLEF
jgi:UDP-glucose 6-dehydrogenase